MKELAWEFEGKRGSYKVFKLKNGNFLLEADVEGKEGSCILRKFEEIKKLAHLMDEKIEPDLIRE